MQAQERPLGLSILGVVNLGLGLLNALSAMYLILAVLAKRGVMALPPGMDPAVAQAYLELPVWFMEVLVATAVLKIVLLVWSGIGYFQLRRRARAVGSAYALVSLGESAVALAALPYGLTREAAIGCLYAVYTLLAVHTMYKPHLTR
jgi:hypothetical protein